MYWLICIGCVMIGFVIGVLATFGAHRERFSHWKPISMKVESRSTNEKLHADRYRLSEEDNLPYLRVYDGRKFSWLPIWHFKSPYLIMALIDPEYAKAHMIRLLEAENFEKFTEGRKT